MKVLKKDVATSMLPHVHDRGGGWDSEFVAEAWQQGLKIVEIPVISQTRWRRKSRVRLIKDIWSLLLDLIRLRRELGGRARRNGST